MKLLRPATVTLIMATVVGLAGALPASAHAVSPGANHQPSLSATHQPKPVSIVHRKEGGLRVTILKYARGVVPFPRGIVPNNVTPGPCSIESSAGLGVEDNGEYEVYCFTGHGTFNFNAFGELYNVETVFAYQDTTGQVWVDGHNRPQCTAVNAFTEYQEIIYNPLAHVCSLTLD